MTRTIFGTSSTAAELLKEYARGGPDTTKECLEVGKGLDWVPGLVEQAEILRVEWEASEAIKEGRYWEGLDLIRE